MTKTTTILLMAGLLAWGCGSSDQEPALEAPPAAAAAPAAPLAAASAAEAPAVAPAGNSNFGTVSLAPGFMPDPSTADGTSGGATDASTLSSDCAGWVATTPDHLFVAGGAFANLRIMAHATEANADVTLVVQKPDGSYLCNDDLDLSVSPDPLVEGAFPAGTYKIWIGSYESGVNASYRLGISELSSVTPASLAN